MNNKGFTQVELLITIGIILLLVVAIIPIFDWVKKHNYIPACGTNLKYLGIIIQQYAADHDGHYPPLDKWCDVLINREGVSTAHFFCIGSGEKQNNLKISCYAINSNVTQNSPNDVVLLFETNPGWNQHGNASILTMKNHKNKGSNILFNDGSVKFIKKNQIKSLRWE